MMNYGTPFGVSPLYASSCCDDFTTLTYAPYYLAGGKKKRSRSRRSRSGRRSRSHKRKSSRRMSKSRRRSMSRKNSKKSKKRRLSGGARRRVLVKKQDPSLCKTLQSRKRRCKIGQKKLSKIKLESCCYTKAEQKQRAKAAYEKRKRLKKSKKLSGGKRRMNSFFRKMSSARKANKKMFVYKGMKYMRKKNPNPRLADVYKRAGRA